MLAPFIAAHKQHSNDVAHDTQIEYAGPSSESPGFNGPQRSLELVQKYKEALIEFGVVAVDEVPDNKSKKKVWVLIENIQKKKTVKGNLYLAVKGSGLTTKEYRFRVWSVDPDLWREGAILILHLDYDKKYGYSVNRHCEIIDLG